MPRYSPQMMKRQLWDLHFECAVYLYQNEEIPSIEADFQETLAKCQEVLTSDYKRQKFFDRMAGRVLRILAPLM